MTEEEMDNFVFAVLPKKTATKMQKELPDLVNPSFMTGRRIKCILVLFMLWYKKEIRMVLAMMMTMMVTAMTLMMMTTLMLMMTMTLMMMMALKGFFCTGVRLKMLFPSKEFF